jgi:lipid II:glycine glycyltransferase (peptidoglycan interpeptide bridge formation enzyme)
MKISIIDPTTDSRWEKFVNSQKHSTIFHTSAWARVVKDTYGYLPQYYALENEADQFKAAIPFYLVKSRLTGKRLVCLPFSDYCWPLGVEEADIALLLDSVKKQVKLGEFSYLEVRGWQNRVVPTLSNLVTRKYYITYMLDLEMGLETLNEKFHDSVRRGIRQAEKRGITVHLTSNEGDLDNFYRLHVMTRKKLGVLPQPYTFFKNLFHHMISQNLGFIVMADCEGKTVVGVVFLNHKDAIYYKFNAFDENYLQKRPNHLVTWEAIQFVCAKNYKYFDFGR